MIPHRQWHALMRRCCGRSPQFYAPWCDRSKTLEPVIAAISEHVAEHASLDIHVAEVNGDEEVALATRFYVEVDRLPYLYIITAEGRTHFFNER